MAMRVLVLLAASLVLVAGCSDGSSSSSAPAASSSASSSASSFASAASDSGLPAGWVDDDVSFTADGVTLYGTYRHPSAAAKAPAVLLIAGSGPTDRDGNQPGFHENSLHNLADALAADGVASLRYDKLFSGRTGGGSFAADPTAAGVAVFTDEAQAALRFLADQARTDPEQLSVLGHSEGGLYALLLAARTAPAVHGSVPPISRLELVEPASVRILDAVLEQVQAQIALAVTHGQLTRSDADADLAQLNAAVDAVRAGRPVGELPSFLQSLFNPDVTPFLEDEDGYDPATVARSLPPGLPVLLTCSANDSQVTCGDTDHLAPGLHAAHARLDYVHLTGVDHGLKEDSSTTGAADLSDEPLAPSVAAALAAFLAH